MVREQERAKRGERGRREGNGEREKEEGGEIPANDQKCGKVATTEPPYSSKENEISRFRPSITAVVSNSAYLPFVK
jgi:hypothetical protein